MSVVKPLAWSYTIQNTNAVEHVAPASRTDLVFRKAFIYPGVTAAGNAGGVLTANAGTVNIGKDNNTQKVLPSTLGKADPPILIEPPQEKGGEVAQMAVNDILISGTAGDGVYIEYWE